MLFNDYHKSQGQTINVAGLGRFHLNQFYWNRVYLRHINDIYADNANLRDQVANTRANEIQEQRNESRRANALRQRQAR